MFVSHKKQLQHALLSTNYMYTMFITLIGEEVQQSLCKLITM